MQTFLPLPNFKKTSKVLDNARLNKQITEAWEIYNVLKYPIEYQGWHKHPAVKMWVGRPATLLVYGIWCWNEWINRCQAGLIHRGNPLHKSGLQMYNELQKEYSNCRKPYPVWFGDYDFHSCHRAVLLGKKYDWYKQFGWKEEPAVYNKRWPYIWPI